uniref:Alpha-catulin n=1 Tax=Strix occidentalis caurina TaxID=311401 RepID=A0A8D0EUS4_STROC
CMHDIYSAFIISHRGEGLLKTTQDLFHQAEIFATEGTKLASALHAFSDQVHDDDKPVLLLEAEKLISMCKQLQITAKASVQGKSATFTKVSIFLLCSINLLQLEVLCCT